MAGYELPDGRGIEFEDVAARETSYAVDLAIDGEDVTTLTWYTEACGPDAEAPGTAGHGTRRCASGRQQTTAEDVSRS